MTIVEPVIWSVANAVLLSIGGGGLLVFALSNWLGKVWAERILEKEKIALQGQFAAFKLNLEKDLYRHNIAVSRIDAQRAAAIKELYDHLIAWHESVLRITGPNDLSGKPDPWILARYASWATDLNEKARCLKRSATQTAIYFCTNTHALIEKCAESATSISNNVSDCFVDAPDLGSSSHRERVEAARAKLLASYDDQYEPARLAVASTFRELLDPLSSITKHSSPSSS